MLNGYESIIMKLNRVFSKVIVLVRGVVRDFVQVYCLNFILILFFNVIFVWIIVDVDVVVQLCFDYFLIFLIVFLLVRYMWCIGLKGSYVFVSENIIL